MKQHIVVKLRPQSFLPDAPHWSRIIADKGSAAESLIPPVDRVLQQSGIAVWVTREFLPAGAAWSPAEYAQGLERVYRLILQQDFHLPADLVDQIALLPEVDYARLSAVAVTPLPEPAAQAMSVSTDRESREAVYVPEAHRWSTGHEGITVAVLDSGIGLTHPELIGTLRPGFDFVDIIGGADEFVGDAIGADPDPDDAFVGHGTHVAGIIGAAGTKMPVGVAPKCRILPVRVLGAMRQGNQFVGAGLTDNINNGLKWAVDQGADVINMSFGIQHAGGGLPHHEVVAYALEAGATLVAATGNDGKEALYYPGALPGVIAVGAADSAGHKSRYSTFGEQVSLVAPGTDVYSSYRENGYAFATGTSQAAPFVSGAVALLKSYALERGGKRLLDRQVKHLLKHTADRPDNRFRTRQTGYGFLNIADALRLLDHRLV